MELAPAEDDHTFPANCKVDVVACPQKAGRSEVDSTHCKTDSEEGSGSRRLRHRRHSGYMLKNEGGEAYRFSGPAETVGAVAPASDTAGGGTELNHARTCSIKDAAEGQRAISVSVGRPPSVCKLTKASAKRIQAALEEELLRHEIKISVDHRRRGFIRSRNPGTPAYEIDKVACESLSRIIRTHNMSIEEATRFVRGEGIGDLRPNKALDSDRLRVVLSGYPHLRSILEIADHGISAEWRRGPHPRRPPPMNHGSCKRYLRAITKSVREGQDSGQYMVVDADILERWPEVVCSPLGAVAKKDTDPAEEVRLIHDLSFPKGNSVNTAFVVDSIPRLRYDSVVIVARQIEHLAARGYAGRIQMLKGDVKTAFRHLFTCASQTFRMAASIEELGILIIDMAAPFGWSGSPPCYGLFGRAISWLVGSNSPASVSNSSDSERFFPYEWVDDHILVELDVGDRLHLAEATLRHAMLAVLGPRSVNEGKFSEWSSELVALGLLWNTTQRTVSIPSEKIVKARGRVHAMLDKKTATKTEFYKVLGSLRHIATCLPAARPFYQRLQSQSTRAPPSGRIPVSKGSRTDLSWFKTILKYGCLAELPLAMFGDMPQADIELYMDASNRGLAVLDPSCNEFIQIQFDEEELAMINGTPSQNDFSINVREHMCIALALWTWGAKWNSQASGRLVHVKCWSDNMSAVTWSNKLHSGNLLSQEINRGIGLAEAYFNLRVTAGHLPGSNKRSGAMQKALQNLLGQLQSQSLASASAKKYSSTWKQWCQWCEWLNFPRWLPENKGQHSYQLALFAVYCWRYGWDQSGSGNAASTVLSKVSHIAWHHRKNLGYSVGLLPGHQLAITGMRRGDPPSNPKSPVTTDILKRLHSQLDFSSTQHRVIWGASVLGFFFLLRRSEYLAVERKVQQYALRRSDISFFDNEGRTTGSLQQVSAVAVRFRGSKSDQFGVGTTRKLERSGHSWCCPVLAAWYLVQHHKALGVDENTLLCKVDATSNLQVRDVVKEIKRAAEQEGHNPDQYGSHSFRSGGATALFNAGFDSLAVKLFGRWKSDAVERYTRIGGRLTAIMAQEMLATPALQRY